MDLILGVVLVCVAIVFALILLYLCHLKRRPGYQELPSTSPTQHQRVLASGYNTTHPTRQQINDDDITRNRENLTGYHQASSRKLQTPAPNPTYLPSTGTTRFVPRHPTQIQQPVQYRDALLKNQSNQNNQSFLPTQQGKVSYDILDEVNSAQKVSPLKKSAIRKHLHPTCLNARDAEQFSVERNKFDPTEINTVVKAGEFDFNITILDGEEVGQVKMIVLLAIHKSYLKNFLSGGQIQTTSNDLEMR